MFNSSSAFLEKLAHPKIKVKMHHFENIKCFYKIEAVIGKNGKNKDKSNHITNLLVEHAHRSLIFILILQ